MVIGIDGNEANVKKRVGVSIYSVSLLHYFQQKADVSTQFKIFLREKPLEDLPKPNDYFSYEMVKGELLWSQIFLPARLNLRRDIDVFFTPAHYAPRLCPVPFVVTIHDLSYFYYPDEFLKKDLYKLQNWTKYSVQRAKKIITVSQNTKKDIMKFYHVPENKIKVVYNGYEKIGQNNELGIKSYGNYILYVGTLQPRKNVAMLIHTFNKFLSENLDFKLIIVGRKGWLYNEIFALVERLKLKDSVIFTDYVSDGELLQLYKNAFCFVLPSLYEGFGIPVLEAMSNGCPVICSNTSSLPEIGGKAALYFNPKSEKDLLKKVNQLKDDEKLRNELIRKGKEQVKKFSWQTCAQQTLEIIKAATKQ